MKKKNILYLLDEKAKIEKVEGSPNIYLCPLTTDKEFIQKAERELSAFGEVVTVPFVREFHRNAFKYRDNFIKFLFDFSTGREGYPQSMKKYFKHPFRGFSLWWFSLIREKSTFKSQSFHDLMRLITLARFKKELCIDEIYVDIESDALKKAILKNSSGEKIVFRVSPKGNIAPGMVVSFIKALGYIVFFAARKCMLAVFLMKHSRERISRLKKAKYLFIVPFPFANGEKLKKRVFRNEYLGGLQESAEKKYKGKVSLVGIPHDDTRANLSSAKLLKKINSWGYCVFLPEELISFWGIVKAAGIFFYTCFLYLFKIPYLSGNFIFNIEAQSVNAWDIFQAEWRYSFFGSYLMKNLFYYYAFERMARAIDGKITAVYPLELYGWENSLNIACRENPDIKTFGIQHTSVPLLILNYFNVPEELKEGSYDSIPLPDCVGVAGGIPMRLFTGSGWPKERLFELGAVRYGRLAKYVDIDTPWASRKKQVIVALSSIKKQTEEMLFMLLGAVKEKNICTFVIKPHLLCNAEDILRSMGAMDAKENFVFNYETPLEELLASSRAAFVAGSAASIDAVICACPLIVPRLSCMADMNPLSGIDETLARYVENKDELASAVNDIINADSHPVDCTKSRTFARDYFTILKNEDEYFDRLDNIIRREQCR